MTEVTTEMPRSRSMPIQSERVRRRSPLARTFPASWMAPPARNRCSVSVVLPASGWEMIANVRRRAISVAYVGAAGSVIRSPCARTPRGRTHHVPLEGSYTVGETENQGSKAGRGGYPNQPRHRSGDRDVGPRKVVSLEQQRHIACHGAGIGETVAQIERDGMAAFA